MEKCRQYTGDGTDIVCEDVNHSWVPFFRQLLICSGLWTTYFMNGLIMGSPTVVIPQLRREANSTEAVSSDMASWLSSVFGISGLPWVFILPLLMHLIGRKAPFMIMCVDILIGFIVFYCSTTVSQILISEIILGLLFTSTHTVSMVTITEYTSPCYRGIFLTIKSASFNWGIWVSNVIGTYFHWKIIGILALICSSYTATVIFWPESPYWLATKGRFEECTASHRWLKGSGSESEKELINILNSQKNYDEQHDKQNFHSKKYFIRYFRIFRLSEFYKPLFISMLLSIQYYSTGKLVCSIYAIYIVKNITESESTAYKTMLILDGFTVFGMYVGCALSKYFKRRTLLIVTSSIGILFLFVISLYLFLIKLSVLIENSFISVTLLTGFSVSISCGPMILCTTLYAELMPNRFKSSSVLIIALFNGILSTTALKIAPTLFSLFTLQGAFLFYAVASSICLLLLYKFLPETKDKTLQEIEECFKPLSISVAETRELMLVNSKS